MTQNIKPRISYQGSRTKPGRKARATGEVVLMVRHTRELAHLRGSEEVRSLGVGERLTKNHLGCLRRGYHTVWIRDYQWCGHCYYDLKKWDIPIISSMWVQVPYSQQISIDSDARHYEIQDW